MFSRSLNHIICLWRNILKIIIIEISLKWIKFRGYLSVFSCIFSTVWPKILPLDSGTQLAGCLCLDLVTLSLFSCPFVLRVNGCVYFYSLQYFCSQTSQKAQICFTNCIFCVISGMFFLFNGPKASNHLLHRTSVWEHWWRMKKPGKL